MPQNQSKAAKDSLPDPSSIPAFDRVMRGLIRVPKSELVDREKRETKKPKRKK